MIAFDDGVFGSDYRYADQSQREILLVKLERIIRVYEVTTGKDIFDTLSAGKELFLLLKAYPDDDLVAIETQLTDAT